MAEQRIERLDEAIEALLAGRVPEVSFEADVALAVVVAGELRGMPDPRFRSKLKNELFPEEKAMSATVAFREGVQSITPYLVVDGAAELIEFMKSAFGAVEQLRVPGPGGRLMHAEVQIGDSKIELGDAPAGMTARPSALHLYVEDVDGLYERAVAAGATSVRPPEDQAYGDRDCSLVDRFGNHWYIGRHQENVSEDELMQRFAGKGTKPRRDPKVEARPEGFRTATPFLHPRGAAKLIDFMKAAFDATEVYPPTVMPDGVIAHAAMRIGDSIVEMGEAHAEFGPMPVHFHVQVVDVDSAYDRALRAGAVSVYEPKDQPYRERSGAVEDPAGTVWYLAAPL